MSSPGAPPARPLRVVVVGAGLGGLSAACHLAGAGHEVTVLEQADAPGGLAGRWSVDGYRIDTGPTVLTMPGLLEDCFAAAGARMDDHLRVRRLDPAYRACFEGAEPLFVRASVEETSAGIASACGERQAEAFLSFCAWLERLYKVEMPDFICRNYNSPLDLVQPVHPVLELLRLGAFRRASAVLEAHFSDNRLRQLLGFQTLYAGLSPYEAFAIYCIITYMDIVSGVWWVEGGIHEIPLALANAAGKRGAEVVYGAHVAEITRRSGPRGAVTGVRLSTGERLAADVVVANVGVPAVYRELLGGSRPPRAARKPQLAPSCLLWLAAARGRLPEGVAHHNVHFGSDWRGSFEAILHDGRLQPDPSILVSVPTVSDASLAPPGGHVLYALEPVPNLGAPLDWTREGSRAKERLLERLDRLGYPVSDVVAERFFDPPAWAELGMEGGTPFGLSHRFLQSGPFRPSNLDWRFPGLVLTGSWTVPGIGVPMVLISGKLAAERVEQLSRGSLSRGRLSRGGLSRGRLRRGR